MLRSHSYRHMFVCFEYEDSSWMDVSEEDPFESCLPPLKQRFDDGCKSKCRSLWGSVGLF